MTLPPPIEGEAHRQGYEPKKGEQENLHESISVVVRRLYLRSNPEGGSKRWRPCRGRTYGPLIKSPAEDLPQDTQHNESAAKGEDS